MILFNYRIIRQLQCILSAAPAYYDNQVIKQQGGQNLDISTRLKKIRTAKGYSVYKLSQLSGVSETHIRDLERGDRNPSLDTVERIANVFGISLSEILNEDETVSYLTSEEKEFLDCYRMLPKNRSAALLAFLKTLK